MQSNHLRRYWNRVQIHGQIPSQKNKKHFLGSVFLLNHVASRNINTQCQETSLKKVMSLHKNSLQNKKKVMTNET